MRYLLSIPLLWLGTLAFTSCNSPTVVCNAIALPGIMMHITDVNGNPIHNPRVIIWEGTDTLSVNSFGGEADGSVHTFTSAYERAGTYSIRIQKAGYEDWGKTGVRVRRETCHVKTVTIDVRMTAE